MLSQSSAWRSYGTLSTGKDDSTKKSTESETNSRKQQSANDRSTNILRYVNLGLMCTVLLGYGMCASLFSPFFPTEAARRGISATTVGFIFGTFTLMMFLGSIASGLLVRKLGLHFMIWSGTLLGGGATVLFGALDLAPIGDAYVVLCFAVRIVEGCGVALYNTAAYSMVAEMYPNSISTSYALLEISNGVGSMIGPTIGGVLFNIGGFSLPFYVVGALLLLLGFISMILLRFTLLSDDSLAKESDAAKSQTSPFQQWSRFYRSSFEMWILTIAIAVETMIFAFPNPTLALYYEKLGLTDPAVVGLVFLGGSLSYTVLSLIVGKMADKFAKYIYQIMTFGASLFVVALVLLGPMPPLQSVLPPSIGLTTASYVLLVSGMGILINPAPAAILAAARKAGFKDGLDTSVMIASLYNAMWFLGYFVGTLLAGSLMDIVGFEWAAFIMAVIGACILVLFVVGIFMPRINCCQSGHADDYSEFKNEESDGSILLKNSQTTSYQGKV